MDSIRVSSTCETHNADGNCVNKQNTYTCTPSTLKVTLESVSMKISDTPHF